MNSWTLRFLTVLATTWVAVMLMISAHLAAINFLPTSFWLDFHEIKVEQIDNNWWIRLERDVSDNRDVRIQLELHEERNGEDLQYCTSSTWTTVEPMPSTQSPLESFLPDCNLRDPLMIGKPLYLQVTYVVDVGYGFSRSITRTSNQFTLQPA